MLRLAFDFLNGRGDDFVGDDATIEELMSEWPAGHNIGVYLSVGDHARLVGTARDRGDLSHLFRHLADEWDRMAKSPDLLSADQDFYSR